MNQEKITIALTIEQILSVQAAITTKLPSLLRGLGLLREIGVQEDCIQFTEQEIQALEAARTIFREALTCKP